MDTPSLEPQLAPPGAGIPLPQRILCRYYLRPFVAGRSKWEESKKHFEKLSEKILKEIEGLSENQLNQRVLVPAQPGLEDSSRYWSVAMTLEHLVIVGRAILAGVESLSHEQVPDYKVDTAKVKPSGKRTADDDIADFKKFSSEEFAALHEKIKNKDSRITLSHPWFGPMTAKEWYWLLAMHQGIHLKQIRNIKKNLTRN